MDLLIFALVVAVVCALAVWAWKYVPAPAPASWLVPALIIVIGVVAVLYRMTGTATLHP